MTAVNQFFFYTVVVIVLNSIKQAKNHKNNCYITAVAKKQKKLLKQSFHANKYHI